MGEKKVNKINDYILNISIIIITSFLTFIYSSNLNNKARETNRIKESIISLLDNTVKYADYSTVDWKKIDTLYIRPYNCDWEFTFEKLVLDKDFPTSQACKEWHLLQNAKKDFHIKATKARTISTLETRKAILNVESSFDSVFSNYTKDAYYMRSFIGNYNPIMSKAFNDLELKIQSELK
ncbi:hypothetical protein [Tenacibaculum ovolyticum]|uniref:hypothetical protein n=1 Tax=Tenacibaculum ovolyticum TaxID=104270 RepID=UPI003BAC1B34